MDVSGASFQILTQYPSPPQIGPRMSVVLSVLISTSVPLPSRNWPSEVCSIDQYLSTIPLPKLALKSRDQVRARVTVSLSEC